MTLTAPHAEYPVDGSVMPVRRFVWRPEPATPLPPLKRPDRLAGRRLVVLGGTQEASVHVATTLTKCGAIVIRLSPGDDAAALAGAIDGIIDLNVGGLFSPACGDAWKEPLRQTVAVLKAVYSDWLGVTDTSRIFYMPVTRMDGQMGYCDAVGQPLGGIWAGLAKTLPREIPNCNVKVLDLCPESYARVGDFVASEIDEWGLFEIGYRQDQRFHLAPQRDDQMPPAADLDSADVVLISGGGRGIGFALARALARNFGCRVVITGRSPAPSGHEHWLEMDEAGLKAWRNQRLMSMPQGSSVAAVRREMEHIGRQIELHRHLKEVESEGLPIEYGVCDFTDVQQVGALIESIGPRLSGIVHNAGIDTPKRLNAKPTEAFIETVAVKVGGFLAILEALNNRPLKFLCSVGSLTGRMGGMVGQLDYAAGNDGLARVGLWAARNTPYLVKTLCWPTWERLGMIANYDATLKYMSALNIEEGLYHWQKELVTGGSAEATYVGHFGRALSPIQLNGFPMMLDLPQTGQLFSHWFYLGAALSFRPFAHLRSRNRIDRRTALCASEFSWRGRAAIPISLLLEFALSLGDWVVPEGYPDLRLEEIRDLRVTLPGLTLAGTAYEFEKEGSGRWEGARWTVTVAMAGDLGLAREPIAALTLVYGAGLPGARMDLSPTAERDEVSTPNAAGSMRWTGTLLRFARWFKAADGTLVGTLRSCPSSDCWSMPLCPVHGLPAAHLENVIRRALQDDGQRDPAEAVAISRIAFFTGASDCRAIRRLPGGDTWLLLDESGGVALSVQGISATTDPLQSLDEKGMRRYAAQ